MSCQQVRKLLDAYVDNELDVVAALEFENHLVGCGACRDLCDRYTSVQRSLHARIPYFEAPEGLKTKVRARLRNETGQNEATRPRWFREWSSWAVAASVIALLISSLMLINVLRRPSRLETTAHQVVSSHIRSLMANHLSDVSSSDQHTVKPWFSGKLDFAPVVKDLAPQGFILTGGRLDYLDDRTVAALVYKRRQHTINLFLWPSTQSESSAAAWDIKGFNVLHWTRGHMTYWAVSDLNVSELNEFARDQQK